MDNSILNFSSADDSRSSILKIAVALTVLQLLFPPKVWNNGFMTQSLGHVFILNDPASSINGMSSGMASTGIAWMTLFGQLVLTAIVAFGAIKFFENR